MKYLDYRAILNQYFPEGVVSNLLFESSYAPKEGTESSDPVKIISNLSNNSGSDYKDYILETVNNSEFLGKYPYKDILEYYYNKLPEPYCSNALICKQSYDKCMEVTYIVQNLAGAIDSFNWSTAKLNPDPNDADLKWGHIHSKIVEGEFSEKCVYMCNVKIGEFSNGVFIPEKFFIDIMHRIPDRMEIKFQQNPGDKLFHPNKDFISKYLIQNPQS